MSYFVSVSAGDHDYSERIFNKKDAINRANHLLALYRKPRREARFGDGNITIKGVDYHKVRAICTPFNFN